MSCCLSVHQFYIWVFTADGGTILHMITFGILREKSPEGEYSLSQHIKKKKQWGVVFTDASVSVADKVTCCGACGSFDSTASFPCTQSHTNTKHTLAVNVLAYLWGTRALSSPMQSFCLSPSLYLFSSHLFGRWNQSSSHCKYVVVVWTDKKGGWE